MINRKCSIAALLAMLAACSTVDTRVDNDGAHIKSTSEEALDLIPEPVTVLPPPPAPSTSRGQLFSVVVVNVPISEVLFTIARDAGINFDIHPDVSGKITINAVDQTLNQILDRMSDQASIRYTITPSLVKVVPDSPYLRSYDIDYPNMTRSSQSTVSIATQVATTGMGAGEGGGGGGGGGNISSTSINNVSDNEFWARLIDNVTAIVRGGDSIPGDSQEGSSGGSEGSEGSEGGESEQVDLTSIIANPESGALTVRANRAQHAEVQAYLDRTMEQAQRQVLIEATIVEVTLNDEFQAGVDWQKFSDSANEGLNFSQDFIGANLGNTPVFELDYSNRVNGALDVSSTVRMLSKFGNTKVLSSPRLMVLNNQTALLKVVDNRVYFTTDVDVEIVDNNILRTFETEIHTVPVGFVMSVTPQISRHDTVTLNARPTISRILGFVEDPNPATLDSDVQNLIPEIQVREMESLLKIQSGNIGVIGGLMQDTIEESTEGVPWLSKVPGVGSLFSFDSDKTHKSELVIFIRPIVIRKASVNRDLVEFERYIPRGLDDESITRRAE